MNKKYRSLASNEIPYKYEITERLVDSEGRVLYWYVLVDRHQVEIMRFDTEPEAIEFIEECKHNEVGIICIFHGRQMELEKVDLLCPKD